MISRKPIAQRLLWLSGARRDLSAEPSSVSQVLEVQSTEGRPFERVFQVLGCQLDLRGVKMGQVVLENKPSRLERMITFLEEVKGRGRLTLREAQVLHGLLRYSCGFFAGRGFGLSNRSTDNADWQLL